MEGSNDATYSDSFGVEHILKKKSSYSTEISKQIPQEYSNTIYQCVDTSVLNILILW